MDSGREVVITGLGVVSPIGIGGAAYWEALRAGRSGVAPIPMLTATDYPVKFGGAVTGFEGKEFVQPRKALKVMCREIQMGYAAAVLAMKDAALTSGQVDPERLGVVYGSEMFYLDLREQESAFRASVSEGRFDMLLWGEKGLPHLYPLWMLQYLPNMVGCHVAITYDARGPNNTIVLGEASSLLALIEASHVIGRGHADVMLVGGVGNRLNLTPLLYRQDGNLSHRGEMPETASRPFDRTRDGMVNGEGAGAVLLESRQHAESRGAKILARLLGTASGHEPRPNGKPRSGRAIRQTLELALRRASLEPKDVGHVKANGLSTVDDDRAEARAIADVLGTTPVTAPKSFFGNLGAGGGLVELAASLFALNTGEIPMTLNYEHRDPECPIEVVHGQPLTGRHGAAVVLQQSGTGQAATVVLGAP